MYYVVGTGALLKKKFGPWPILRAHFGPRPKILRAHFGPWPDWSRGAKNSKFTRSVTCLKEIGIIWSMDYSERRCFVSLRVVHGPRVPYRIWSMIPEFSDRFGPWTNLVHGPNSFSGGVLQHMCLGACMWVGFFIVFYAHRSAFHVHLICLLS